MVQLSTKVHLIKAVRFALSPNSNVLGSHPSYFIGDHRKEIAFASYRSQVVRPYTSVTTTQAIFPCPTEPTSTCLQRACQSRPTMHRASGPDTHFLPRMAITKFSGVSPCPGAEIVCTAALRCSSSSGSSSFSPITAFSLRSNTKLVHYLSCRSL